MRTILISLILVCQLVIAYFTWASYKLDKDFTDSLNQSEEQQEETSHEIHV